MTEGVGHVTEGVGHVVERVGHVVERVGHMVKGWGTCDPITGTFLLYLPILFFKLYNQSIQFLIPHLLAGVL